MASEVLTPINLFQKAYTCTKLARSFEYLLNYEYNLQTSLYGTKLCFVSFPLFCLYKRTWIQELDGRWFSIPFTIKILQNVASRPSACHKLELAVDQKTQCQLYSTNTYGTRKVIPMSPSACCIRDKNYI